MDDKIALVTCNGAQIKPKILNSITQSHGGFYPILSFHFRDIFCNVCANNTTKVCFSVTHFY